MSKLIAFHLPQFHPIPENDQWWGKGFTEWTNVTRAKPLFKGHYQPHLPADLGFYDLRLPEARLAQAELAREYGIYGFCYYHYWFNGRRLLNQPIDEIFQSGEPDFPFMLCWANENWTRRWDGGDETVLMAQQYSVEDAYKHIHFLLPRFQDHRYIRIQNKPVFAIYRSTAIPNLKAIIDIFRTEASKVGLDLHLVRVESFGEGAVELMEDFDAAIEFQPFSEVLNRYRKEEVTKNYQKDIVNRVYNKLLRAIGQKSVLQQRIWDYYNHLDYNDYVDFLLTNDQYPLEYTRYPCVTPGWDNTARKGNQSFLFKNSTPEAFGRWLDFHKKQQKPADLIFINAWNEWAEGNHLEPCQKWGHQYLEMLKD